MNLRTLTSLTTVGLLAGCSLAPDYQQPQSELPTELGLGKASDEYIYDAEQLETWWTVFKDDELNRLVDRALNENFDIRAAMQNVLAARANLGYAKANQWPMLTANSNISRQDYPNTLSSSGAGLGGPQDSFELLGMLDYEIDLWGKLANSSNAARESLLSTAFAYETIRTTLAAEVASTYFNLRATRKQIAITEDTIKARQETFDLQTVRRDGGLITELEKQQAAAELAAAKAELPGLREQASLLNTSLAVLVGASPAELWAEHDLSSDRELIPPPPGLPLADAPISLLSRRPDIIAADAQARSLTYQIGVVKAERWPTISVGALGGVVSDPLGKVFSDDTRTWSITGAIAGTLYDFGRNAAQVEAAEAYQAEAMLRYQQVVQQAFRELRDSVDQLNFSEERIQARAEQLQAIDRTVELAQSRYDEGYSNYLDLLSSQNVQFSVQLTLVDAWLSRYLASVSMFKALGGGWDVPTDREAYLLVFEPKEDEAPQAEVDEALDNTSS